MKHLAAALTLPLLLVAGCASSDDGEVGFRHSIVNQNPDIDIHTGGTTDNDDCLIWDIKDGCSHESGDQSDPSDDVFRNELAGDDLVDLEGNVLCYVDGKALKRASDDATLARLQGNRIEDGDGNTVYSFAADHIFFGQVSNQDVGFTADANLSKATPGRKLQIATLLLDLDDCFAATGRDDGSGDEGGPSAP
jgi:hypothetical protein